MLNKSIPAVSVVMITYNHEPFVAQAIESVLGQKTTFPFELIIGEDMSGDQTRAICEKYAGENPGKITLLPSERNLGVTPNFARTILGAKGRYLAFCEGDDYWCDPEKLQKQFEFLEHDQDYVASFHRVMVIDAAGSKSRGSKNSSFYEHDVGQAQMISGKVISLVSLFCRNVVKEFPEEFYRSPTGDNFFASLLGHYGKAKFQAEIVPSAYRMHNRGMWSLQKDSDQRMILLRSYFWIWQYYERIGRNDYGKFLYGKILMEGFYSNPFEGKSVRLGSLEAIIVKQIRRLFRLSRFILNKIYPN